MCKVAAFYEGGIPWSDLAEMPINEFFHVVEVANMIADERKKAANRG